MTLDIENPKHSTIKQTNKNLLKLINESSKDAGTKSTYQSQLCFYTLTIKYLKKEIK